VRARIAACGVEAVAVVEAAVEAAVEASVEVDVKTTPGLLLWRLPRE